MKELTCLSLFSGIGGIDLAAEWAGFRTVAFCENNSYCQKILHKHWPTAPIYHDIRELNGSYFKHVTLLTGGFPCQPFSMAGKKKGAKDDRYLWPEMLRVIRESQPTWVVGENVANILNMLEFEDICTSLEKENYQVQSLCVPATSVGARQHRKRVFIIAYNDGARVQGESSRDRSACKKMGWSTNSRGSNDSSIRRAYFRIKDSLPPSLSSIRRKADGIPGELDELRAQGNAVIPQHIYPVLKIISDIENGIVRFV